MCAAADDSGKVEFTKSGMYFTVLELFLKSLGYPFFHLSAGTYFLLSSLVGNWTRHCRKVQVIWPVMDNDADCVENVQLQHVQLQNS